MEQLEHLYTAKEKAPPLIEEAKRVRLRVIENEAKQEGTDRQIIQRLSVPALNNMNKHINSDGT